VILEKIRKLEPAFFYPYLLELSRTDFWLNQFVAARELGHFYSGHEKEVEDCLSDLIQEGPILDGVGRSLSIIMQSHFQPALPMIRNWINSEDVSKRRSTALGLIGLIRSGIKDRVKQLSEEIGLLAADQDYKVSHDIGSRMIRIEMGNHMPDLAMELIEQWSNKIDFPRLQWQSARALSPELFRTNSTKIAQIILFLQSAHDADGMIQKAVQSTIDELQKSFGRDFLKIGETKN